jgi:LacI family transcriptional regulator
MAGITDVARLAGVSITTASRVLNPVAGYPIAATTRQRVLAAAESLQYSPSAIARALVTRRSRIVGALVGDIVDPYFAEVVRGVEDVARRANYLVVVCNTDRDAATERRYVAALRDYRADAMLFLGGEFTGGEDQAEMERELTLAQRQGTVLMALVGNRGRLPSIDVDHQAGARQMAEHLIELGHRRIGFIAGPAAITTARARLTGFHAALAAAGLEASLMVEGDFTYEGGAAAASRLLEAMPTAIFAANDEMALGAMAAARSIGLELPCDLSIVGFGDTRRARQATPALTTVSIPRQRIGAAAMEMVAAALGPHKTPVTSRVVPIDLVIRESAHPPGGESCRRS